jgi:uncharacterized protein YndB with AHSA1/START domain
LSTDRIEKSVVLAAPLARAWRALSDAREFGAWFGVSFDEPFVEGERLTGSIVPTQVDADIAKMQEPHAGKRFEFVVERIEPMRRIQFRWHPFAIDPAIDYSKEPSTLIVFELEEVPGGTRLTVTESGFDRIPIERRANAFAANEAGWAMQMRLVSKWLALHP